MATDNAAAGSTRTSAAVSVADPAKTSFSFANPLDSIDENKKLNLLLFLVLMVVFGFGLYCYSRIGLDFGFVCDVFNVSQTYARISSPAMFMFVFLFSLSIAIAALASRGLPRMEAVGLSAIVSFLSAIGFGLAFPSYLYPFIGFAFAIVATAYFACKVSPESSSLSDVSSIISSSMLVFTIAACLLAAVAGFQGRDQYYGEFFSGLAGSSPVIMAQGAGVFSKIVTNFQITPAVLEQYVPRDSVRAQLIAQVRSQVETMLPEETVRSQLSISTPGFASLDSYEQERRIEEVYAAAVSKTVNESNEDQLINATYEQLSVQAGSFKASLAKSLEDLATTPPKRLSKEKLADIKAQVSQDPAYLNLYDLFPFVLVLIVFSVFSIVSLPFKILTGLLMFIGFKLQN